MITRLILVAVVGVLALALAACGGGDGITVPVARPDTERLSQLETPTELLEPDLESRTWTCYALSDFRKATPLVNLTQADGVGKVVISGGSKLATVQGVGLNLRWDFSDLNIDDFADAARGGIVDFYGLWFQHIQHLPYAFVLQPDGTGLYYDFSASEDGTAKPSQIFRCLRS